MLLLILKIYNGGKTVISYWVGCCQVLKEIRLHRYIYIYIYLYIYIYTNTTQR